MGGVVNFVTKKDAGSSAYVQGGSYGAYGAGGIYSGKYFTAGASYYNENGISAADKKFGNTEKDGYTSKNFFVRHYLDDFNGYHHEISLLQNTNHVEFDNDQADADNYADSTYTAAKFGVGYKVNAYWDPTLTVGTTVSDRMDYSYSSFTPYHGISKFTELGNKFTFGSISTVNLGGKYTKDEVDANAWSSFTDRAYAETKEAYLNAAVKPIDGLNFQLGGRYSDAEGFKDTYTYSAGGSYTVEPIRLTIRAAAGTAFKTPSLDNLYNPNWGNKDLKAQNSSSWEVGLTEVIIPQTLSVNVTYFDTEFKNRIKFVYTAYPSGYFTNSDSASTKGVEAGITAQFSMVSANISYTYTDFEESDADPVLRRPQNKAKASVTVKPVKEFTATAEAVYVDKMEDFDWVVYQDVSLSDYTLVSLYLSYDPTENLTLFLNGKNLLDKEYYNSYGYAVKGLDIVGGVKYNW
jgi:vitamin B12 transporter